MAIVLEIYIGLTSKDSKQGYSGSELIDKLKGFLKKEGYIWAHGKYSRGEDGRSVMAFVPISLDTPVRKSIDNRLNELIEGRT